jgi:ATP-dependent DNA helicase RecG
MKVIQATTQKTTRVISDAIKDNPAITRKELAGMIGLTEDGIKFHLKKLKRQKKIRRVGPDKGGRWEVRSERHA